MSVGYAAIVEVWSAVVLFGESKRLLFVAVLVGGILGFYAIYGWLLQVWYGNARAMHVLLVLIAAGIGIHALLIVRDAGELFGPVFLTVFLDGLRIVAAILLVLTPGSYWRSTHI
jgi:hypothetical protein